MQDCFRAHPDVYGAELEEDEEAEGTPAPATGAAPSDQGPSAAELDASPHPDEKRARAKEVRDQVKAEVAEQGEHPEADALLPKATHDAEEKNQAAQKTEK
jgi:mitochondrial intermembrane space import and assembly protein 40